MKEKDILDLSDFPQLTDKQKRKRIDEVTQYLWDNIWVEIESKKNIIEEVINLSEQIDYTIGIAFSTLNLAVYYDIQSSPQALPLFKNAHSLYKSINDTKGILQSLNGIASAYTNAGLFDKALDYYWDIVNKAELKEYEEQLATAYHNIAVVYVGLKITIWQNLYF